MINLIVSGQNITQEVCGKFPSINFYFLENSVLDDISEDGNPTILLLSEWPTDIILTDLMQHIRPYYVFMSHDLVHESLVETEFVKRMLPSIFQKEALIETLSLIERISYDTQYGAKLRVKDIVLNSIVDHHSFSGNAKVRLELKSLKVFKPLLSWNTYLVIEQDKPIEIWPEFTLDSGVELQYRILRLRQGGSDSIVSSAIYTLEDLSRPIVLEESGEREYVSISVLGRGEGSVEIGPVHWRLSRLSFGQLILGGNRYSDEKRQEFFSYFNPGDLKPPLNVYFSGYRPAEGFEGYHMMNALGSPFLLISDPRLEGGAFYLGSEQYEQAIIDVIHQSLAYLGFDQQQLILSGLSMGTFGALYYGAKLKPNAIIVGKPLVNLGQVAANIRTVRPNEFGTASDLVLEVTKGTTNTHGEALNNRFWSVFEEADLTETKLYISYMQHDDYDVMAFKDLIKSTSKTSVQIVSKGFEGRHNDNTSGIVRWFVYRFREHLTQEFKRAFNGME